MILNLIQDLQRLPLLLLNNMRGRFQIKFGMTSLYNNGGFTLIELLVVVLIIGILTTVAVPQYNKAVWKSRFATIKMLTKSLAQAQEVYYLANGSYTDRVDKLDIEIPTPSNTLEVDNYGVYYYPWGSCTLETVENTVDSVTCTLQKEGITNDSENKVIAFLIHLNHSTRLPGTIICFAYGSDQTTIPYQICKNETNHTTPDTSWKSANNYGWKY